VIEQKLVIYYKSLTCVARCRFGWSSGTDDQRLRSDVQAWSGRHVLWGQPPPSTHGFTHHSILLLHSSQGSTLYTGLWL